MVDGTRYEHWERECKTCQLIMRLEADNERLQRVKNKPAESGGGWLIENSASVAEIENEELRSELVTLRAEVERLRGELKGE